VGLTNLEPLAALTRLTRLDLRRCRHVTSVEPLAALTELTQLDLSASIFGEVSPLDLEPLAALTKLTRLDLSFRTALTSIEPLADLTGLTQLNLTWCESLTSLEGLGSLTGLTQLDPSGCKSLTNLEPLAHLTGLTQLNLWGCESLTNLEPLTTLTGLTQLNLSSCTALTNLEPLAHLTGLTQLNLSFCTALTNLDPLAHLTGLTQLNLSSCTALTNLDPLAHLTGLTELDLRDCECLTTVKALSRAMSLEQLDLEGCRSLRDVEVLANNSEIRTLDYDIDPPLAASILASCAVLREDSPYVEEHAEEWLDLLPRSKTPDVFASRLARAFALGGAASWTVEALGRLVEATKKLGEPGPTTWEEIFTACLGTGEPAFRGLFDKALEGLSPHTDGVRVLAPWLIVLSRAPESARGWAIETANRVLEPLRKDPVAREIGPAICLFFARHAREDRVREWLSIATDEKAPVWRDRVHLALLRLELEQGDPAKARSRLRKIQTDTTKDAAREELALALARSAPEEAGESLAEIADTVRKAALAAKLSGVPEFTGSLENTCRLLLALEENPEALADLLGRLAEAHPDSPLVREFARQCAPPGATKGLAGAAQEMLLGNEDLSRLLGTNAEWRRVLEDLASDETRLRALLARGIASGLTQELGLDFGVGQALVNALLRRSEKGTRNE